MRPLRNGDHGNDVKRLQKAIGRRNHFRDAPNHIPQADGVMGPETRLDLHYAAYLLGMDLDALKRMLTGPITPEEQQFVLNPGRRDQTTLARAKRRVAAHKRARAKQKHQAQAASRSRQRIVTEARKAASNYRQMPLSYHYLAGGLPNTIYLHPTPRDWRSDCSQFAASVFKGAGLPSPASVAHQWASTFTMVKAPGVKVVDRAHRKPGMLGMYGSREAPHHVEIWCGDEFIGHGSPPIDSLTPGEPDYYLDFPFLN